MARSLGWKTASLNVRRLRTASPTEIQPPPISSDWSNGPIEGQIAELRLTKAIWMGAPN